MDYPDARIDGVLHFEEERAVAALLGRPAGSRRPEAAALSGLREPRPSKRASEHQRRAFALCDFAIGLVAIEIGGGSRPHSPMLRWMFQKSASSRLDMYLPHRAGCVGLLLGDGEESVCVHWWRLMGLFLGDPFLPSPMHSRQSGGCSMKNAKKADFEYKKPLECFPFGTGKDKRTFFHLEGAFTPAKVRLLFQVSKRHSAIVRRQNPNLPVIQIDVLVFHQSLSHRL